MTANCLFCHRPFKRGKKSDKTVYRFCLPKHRYLYNNLRWLLRVRKEARAKTALKKAA